MPSWYCDETTKGFIVDLGKFILSVGSLSMDICLSTEVNVLWPNDILCKRRNLFSKKDCICLTGEN